MKELNKTIREIIQDLFYIDWNKKGIEKYIQKNKPKALNEKDYPIGDSALNWACQNEPQLAKELLMKKEIELHSENILMETPIIQACSFNKELLKYFKKRKDFDINYQNNEGETVLMWCCEKRSCLVPAILNFSNININLKNKEGKTALDIAHSNKHKNNSYIIIKNFYEHSRMTKANYNKKSKRKTPEKLRNNNKIL